MLFAALAAPGADASELPRCGLCGDEIRGGYLRFDTLDLNTCSHCSAGPSCPNCSLPMSGSNVGDGENCRRCIDEAERCNSCGLPIFERYWKVAGTEGVYCRTCREDAPSCTSCGAPSRSVVRRDGRILCAPCDSRRVTHDGEYSRLYREMQDRARDRLGLVLEREPPLVVESEAELRSRPGITGHHDAVTGIFVRDRLGRGSIHILTELTASRAAAVLAHEFAHAWQAERCPEEQSLRLREGFAEWVAWRVLEGWDGGESEREIIAARTDEYGLGFRWFRDLEASRGTSFAVWWATAATSSEDRLPN